MFVQIALNLETVEVLYLFKHFEFLFIFLVNVGYIFFDIFTS